MPSDFHPNAYPYELDPISDKMGLKDPYVGPDGRILAKSSQFLQVQVTDAQTKVKLKFYHLTLGDLAKVNRFFIVVGGESSW